MNMKNVTAWGAKRAKFRIIECRKCGKESAALSVYHGTGSLGAAMKVALQSTLVLVVWIVFWLGGTFGGAVLQARLIDIGVVSDIGSAVDHHDRFQLHRLPRWCIRRSQTGRF